MQMPSALGHPRAAVPTQFINDMPHELPKSYEPGEIEKRWAEYWVKEKLFSAAHAARGETNQSSRCCCRRRT